MFYKTFETNTLKPIKSTVISYETNESLSKWTYLEMYFVVIFNIALYDLQLVLKVMKFISIIVYIVCYDSRKIPYQKLKKIYIMLENYQISISFKK